MNISQVTPPEAYAALQQDPHAVYLDVRTEAEFEAGHPAGARNVPVVFFDAATRQPAPNAEFVAVVERHVPRSGKVVVGCASGVRSQRACELLAQAGYTDVSNVRGGFAGARDPSGIVPGWAEAGLPVERGQTSGASYAELKAKR
jgi:rhodanese-related sulfurtransferase